MIRPYKNSFNLCLPVSLLSSFRESGSKSFAPLSCPAPPGEEDWVRAVGLRKGFHIKSESIVACVLKQEAFMLAARHYRE